MSNTSGTPFDDGVDPDLMRDPFAEFLSESDIARQRARPAGASDEIELFALEDVAAQAFRAGRSRSFSWPLVTAAVVTAIVAVSLPGLMMRGRALPSGERLVQPAVSGVVSPLPSAPVVADGAAAAVPVTEQVQSPTSSGVRGRHPRNIGSRTFARTRTTATAEVTAISAHRLSSGNGAQALLEVAPARASLLALVPASPTVNSVIPASSTPADLRVTATVSDPDGDELTYRWSAPVGRFANAMERETVYTCPDTATTVALTITVTDGHGGIASDTLTIHCVEP